MASARAMAFGGGVAARLAVPARRQDIAVLQDLVVRGSSARFPLREFPVGSAPSAGTFGAQQRRRCAGSMTDQLAWLSAVLVTSPAHQRARCAGPAASMAATAFSSSCFGALGPLVPSATR